MIENEIVPSTLEEVMRYGKIYEHGQNKYLPASTMLENFAKDFDFQNVFITRAIKLAEKEEKYGLQQLLVELLSFNKEIIYQVQRLQGKLSDKIWMRKTMMTKSLCFFKYKYKA